MFDDQKTRLVIKVTLGLLALFLLVKTVGEIQSYRFIGSSPAQQSIITVSGKGKVTAIPDIATFSFSVTEESLQIATAQNEAAEKSNAIIAYLKKNGVAEKDIQTSGYNLYPRYEYRQSKPAIYPPYPEGERSLAAYVVTQSVSVKVRDLANAGKILGGIGELGATDISGLSFDNDKRDELVKEARDKAIAEARAEAEKLAKSLGVRLIRIVSYNEAGNYPIYAKYEAFGRGGDAIMAGSAPDLAPGENEIISNVNIMYEIK